MIRFGARPQERAFIRQEGAYSGQGTNFSFEKQQNYNTVFIKEKSNKYTVHEAFNLFRR